MIRSLTILFLVILASCKKEDTKQPDDVPQNHPEMQYFNLNNAEVRYGQNKKLYFDADSKYDLYLEVLPVGDPIYQRDKYIFSATSGLYSYVLIGENNHSPVFNNGDTIPFNNIPDYNWYEVNEVFLAQKVIEMTGDPYWEGPWKDVQNKYLALQLLTNGKKYNGWVEISFDTVSEKLILHRAAVSKEAERAVKAGF